MIILVLFIKVLICIFMYRISTNATCNTVITLTLCSPTNLTPEMFKPRDLAFSRMHGISRGRQPNLPIKQLQGPFIINPIRIRILSIEKVYALWGSDWSSYKQFKVYHVVISILISTMMHKKTLQLWFFFQQLTFYKLLT